MKRRQFIKGAVAVAVAASIPGGDGVELNSMAHPYTHKTYETAQYFTLDGRALTTEYVEIGAKMHRALARSMMQTREIVAANVFNKAFGG